MNNRNGTYSFGLLGSRGLRTSCSRVRSITYSFALLGFLWVSLLSSCAPSNPRQPAPATTLQVQVALVMKKSYIPTLETFGTLTYTRKADVYSPVEGTLESLSVEEGDWVEKDQILALLSKDKLLLSRDQVQSSIASKEALLTLAEEKIREGRRAVEVRILSLEKSEAEFLQKKVEYDYLAQLYQNKLTLYTAGGISGSEIESLKTQYLKNKHSWEQTERDLRIQRIGLQDSDLQSAGLPVPPTASERLVLFQLLHTTSLLAERDMARAELQAAKIELRRIELLLSEAEIRSPLSGIVRNRNLEIGERVTPDTPLFSIYDPTSLYALVEVNEKDLPHLYKGQLARVEIDGKDSTASTDPKLPLNQKKSKLSGQVHLINPYVHTQSRSTHVRIRLDLSKYNSDTHLRILPGMFVRATCEIGAARSSLCIPTSALIRGQGTQQNEPRPDSSPPSNGEVFVLRNSTLVKVPVRVGEKQNGEVEILGGLKEGEQVVLNPSPLLQVGDRAEPLP